MRLINLLIVVIFFSPHLSFCQKSDGNWLIVTYYSTSYIKLRKNRKVVWFTSDCKDRGTKKTGCWTQANDTVRIKIDNSTSTFIRIEDKLCHLSSANELTPVKYGIPKSNIRTVYGVKSEARKRRRRRRSERLR